MQSKKLEQRIIYVAALNMVNTVSIAQDKIVEKIIIEHDTVKGELNVKVINQWEDEEQ